jgi:hypothetical protein
VEKNPGLKTDHVDTAYAIALNYVTLQYGQIHPDVDRFFKTIRKSYPLHTKRSELESEIQKPKPDPERIKQLALELRELKTAVDGLRQKRPLKE